MKNYFPDFLKTIFNVVLFMMLLFVIQIPILSELEFGNLNPILRLLLLVVTFGFALFFCCKYVVRVSGSSLLSLSIKSKEDWLRLAIVVILDLFIICTYLILPESSGVSTGDSAIPSVLLTPEKNWIHFIVYMVVTCLTQPLLEELLFRGALLGSLQRYSWWVGLLLSSILFTYIHGFGSFSIFHLLSGLLYGWLFLKTKRIWPSIVSHMLHNLVIITVVLCSI